MAVVKITSGEAYEFACHAASCAPPPAGTGGSRGGGGGRSGSPVRPNPVGPGAGRNPNQKMIDRTIRKAEMKSGSARRVGVDQGSVQVESLKKGDRVVFAQKVRTVSSVGKQSNGKVGISFKDGGVTDMPGSSTLPRPSKKVRVPAGSAAKFVKAPAPDKKWAANPNNPRNQQRHPDDDRASKKIIRAKTRKPWTEAVGSKSWTETG